LKRATMPSLPVPDLLQPWIGSSPRAATLFTAAAGALLIGLLVILWLAFGPGPRRRRAFRRAQQLLQAGSWKDALALLQDLEGRGRLSASWQRKLHAAQAGCHHAAASALLSGHEYEKGLDHLLQAAQLTGQDGSEARAAVVGTMLAEARQLFAASAPTDTGSLFALLARIQRLQPACTEAFFWQALGHVREGKSEEAVAVLRGMVSADERAPEAGRLAVPAKRALDPLLYLGALLLRRGEAREALRYLTEANRLDSNCPFVIAQLGVAMIEAGGDPQFAVRALQRALGPRGFLLWRQTPQRAWVEGLPELSFVRRLAGQHPFVCPLWGGDLQPLLRQAGTALAEGHYRLGAYTEAAEVFHRLLQEGAPSLPVLRGLGMALTRLERFDQAFKHLRAAHELSPEDRGIAGYLALCGARGKPIQPEDKVNNLAWAIWLVGKYSAPGDAEWAGLLSTIFAEARASGVAVAVKDQVQLCDQLLSVQATDPQTAEAYCHLQATEPQAVRPEYAWLYCRAAQQHGLSGEHTLDLFARTFQDEAAARAFFTQHGWDFEEVEYTYLARAAERQSGRFPEALGAEYPARGEALLLRRAQCLEEAGQADAALAATEVFLKLAPHNARAHDRLAQLHYRRGNLDQAVMLLRGWGRLEPANHLPALRQAVICQQRGDLAGCVAAIDSALALNRGRRRGEVAYLGARLTLAWLFAGLDGKWEPAPDPEQVAGSWRQALALLEECLKEQPDHAEALWCAAAVRTITGDQRGLAAQSPAMTRPDVADGRFHFLAGVCHLAADNHAALAEACERAAADPALAVESAYLMGWSFIQRREPATAALAFQRPAQAQGSPSAAHAQAILGAIRFHQGVYEEAVGWWQRLDEGRRKDWHFGEALAGAAFLAALAYLRAARFEPAAERLREAGQLGLRDRRLGPLLGLALFKAGQARLYEQNGKPAEQRWEEAARLLEQAGQAGFADPSAAYLLALAYKRRGMTAEARAALRKITRPDGNVVLQLGVLALAEGLYADAEQDFARAWEMEPASYEAAYNLLIARLALGQLPACLAQIPKVIPLAPVADEKRFLALLGALIQRTLPAGLVAQGPEGQGPAANGEVQAAVLAGMGRAQEQRLLQLLSGLGQLETAYPLLRTLAEARPHSPAVQEAHVDVVLAQARRLAERCQWTAAEQLLQPLARLIGEGAAPAQTVPRATQVALFNLLGCCAFLTQEAGQAVRHFSSAVKLASQDAWLHQNLALAYEQQNRLDQADTCWNRYFELLDGRTPAPAVAGYHDSLAFEGLSRLGEIYTKKEKWTWALPYVERAHRLRPQDAETLERLFHLYSQVRRQEDARRTLRKLRDLRPGDPQYELYELDVREVRTLDDIDRMLGDVRRILAAHPNDMRVEERAVAMVANVIPNIGRQCDHHSDRLARIVEQVRRLPSYQVNWPIVHGEMHKLRKEFQKLRRLAQKCLPLVSHAEHRRVVKELTELIDSKIEVCQSLGD
jgi:tetratricopeptide (TPR) repeat protein